MPERELIVIDIISQGGHLLFLRWPPLKSCNALLNVTVVVLEPVVVYFDTKIAIVSVSEADILDYTNFDVKAILKIQDGRHVAC